MKKYALLLITSLLSGLISTNTWAEPIETADAGWTKTIIYDVTLEGDNLSVKLNNTQIFLISKSNIRFEPQRTKEAPEANHLKYHLKPGTVFFSNLSQSLNVKDVSLNTQKDDIHFPVHLEFVGNSLLLKDQFSGKVLLTYYTKEMDNQQVKPDFGSMLFYDNKDKDLYSDDNMATFYAPPTNVILENFIQKNQLEINLFQLRALLDLRLFEYSKMENTLQNASPHSKPTSIIEPVSSQLNPKNLLDDKKLNNTSLSPLTSIEVNEDKTTKIKDLKGYESIQPSLEKLASILKNLNDKNAAQRLSNSSNRNLEYPKGIIINSSLGNFDFSILKALSNDSNTCLISINSLAQLTEGVQEAKFYSTHQGPCFLYINVMNSYQRLFNGVDLPALRHLLNELDQLTKSTNDDKSNKNLETTNSISTMPQGERDMAPQLIPVLVFEDWEATDDQVKRLSELESLSLLRNDRFINKINIEKPNAVERESLLNNQIKNKQFNIAQDLKSLVFKTDGWTRDLIKAFLNEAAIQGSDKTQKDSTISTQDLDIAYEKVREHKQTLDNAKESSHFEKLNPKDNPLNFSNLAGVSDAKKALDEIVRYLKNPDDFSRLGAVPPKGILLYGPPGTGKTTLARALAGETGVCFITVSGSQFVDKYVGVGAERVRNLFKEARNSAPCIIFIDELDALANSRDDDVMINQEHIQTVNQLLAEIDGIDIKKNKGVIVVGATNMLNNIDPALLRPGRFERHVLVGFPNTDDRLDVLTHLSKDKPFGKDCDLSKFVEKTAGWSNADLNALINGAILEATKSGAKEVSPQHLDNAFKEVMKNVNNTRSSVFEFMPPDNIKARFKDIVGKTEAKDKLADILMYLKNPERFTKMGANAPKGVLLYGPPGTGKTSLVRALAGEANACFISTSGSDFFRKRSVSQMRDMVEELFRIAQESAPCIIFIDEMESIVPSRDNLNSGLEPIVNEFLTQMDNILSKQNENVIVIGATNYLNKIDKAVLRPGRLDRRIEIKLPTTEDRVKLLEVFVDKVKHEAIDYKKFADLTAGYSPAAIENLVNEATYQAAKSDKEKLTNEILQETYDKVNQEIRKLAQLESPQEGISDSNFEFLSSSQIDVTFKDVAGMKEAKTELIDFINYIKNPEEFERLGAKSPKGVLLYGPPGTGKTMLARALAGEVKTCFISASGSQFNEKFIGVGAARIRKLFDMARESAPCIIFIDELDALAPNRFDMNSSQENTNTTNQLLAEMDGINKDKNAQIYLIGATNDINNIDPALLRAGRLDRHINIDLPSKEDRKELFTMLIQKIKVTSDVSIEELVKMSSGWSNAAIANWINEATISATRNKKEAVNMKDFTEAKHRIELGVNVVGTPSQEELERTAYHEVGHALVYLLQGKKDMDIESLTISPRGHSLGVTMYHESEEKNYTTKSEMMSQIAMAMGGRAAEELVYGKEEVSGGAGSDLQFATDMARAMVTQLGHSDLGLMVLYGDENKKAVTTEVNKILSERYQFALETLTQNKNLLDEIVKELLKKETLTKEELLNLVEKYKNKKE